jgi:transcriptional regulator with AAA-type ATPase domain
MSLFTPEERRFATALDELIHCNPFLPRRIELERAALADDFDERNARWNAQGGNGHRPPTVSAIADRAAQMLEKVRRRRALEPNDSVSDHDLKLYESVVCLIVFGRQGALEIGSGDTSQSAGDVFDSLVAAAKPHLELANAQLTLGDELPHLYACFYQARRAFANIYNYILGASAPATRLRAAVWESVFTHDMRRYRRLLYSRMADYTTLIIGPTGTGKELVARAIGLSRYVPYDPQTRSFAIPTGDNFFPLNLSALSQTLIESELFGHKRGSFTGAIVDRVGWLEICPPLGTVFLDEIGELDAVVQVKLLRVLQERTFSRLGETKQRRFRGKIIAATNRDLSAKICEGTFRDDFYYRLCADIVVVPTLAERFADEPGELRQLIQHLVRLFSGEEAQDVVNEVEQWIVGHLGRDYEWPGNVRELEQCVRNILVHKYYKPPLQNKAISDDDRFTALAEKLASGKLTLDELLHHYCRLVYTQTGSYEATARRLRLDRRTVRAKIHRRPRSH